MGASASHGHASESSVSLHFPPFTLENDCPIQECQFFKVDLHIHICL